MDTDGILKPVTLCRFPEKEEVMIHKGKHFDLKVNTNWLPRPSCPELSYVRFRRRCPPVCVSFPRPGSPLCWEPSGSDARDISFVCDQWPQWWWRMPRGQLCAPLSCHWEGLATVELGTVLCETWPESLRLASRGEWAEVVQTLQFNSFGSLGDISFDLHSPPSPSHCPAATSFSSHSHTWGPFLDTLIMYRSIPRN